MNETLDQLTAAIVAQRQAIATIPATEDGEEFGIANPAWIVQAAILHGLHAAFIRHAVGHIELTTMELALARGAQIDDVKPRLFDLLAAGYGRADDEQFGTNTEQAVESLARLAWRAIGAADDRARALQLGAITEQEVRPAAFDRGDPRVIVAAFVGPALPPEPVLDMDEAA